VFAEGSAGVGGKMGDNLGAGGGNGCAVEIVVPKKGGMGRERWMDTAGTEKVERENGLRKETVPFGERKSRISGAEEGDKVIFKRPDGTFGSIGTMLFGGNPLEVDPVFLKSILEGLGAFIIKDV
jgi:hypothetical protein